MKRKVIIVCCIVCALFLSCLAVKAVKTWPLISYTMEGNSCFELFDCTPTEFFDKEFSFYEETGDFRKNAYINDEGYLVIWISKEQAETWRQTQWLTTFPEIADYPDIEISEDLSTLTVYVTQETDWDIIQPLLRKIATKIFMIKNLSGLPREKFSFTYIEKNRKTGEVLHTEKVSGYK